MIKMKIVIFGATGYSGKEVLKQALSQNHQVTVLTRSAKSVSISHKNLTVVGGNVLDSKTVNAILQNQEAVIQCLGIGGKGDGKPTTFISDATKIIVAEMEKTQVKRLIAMSNVGAGNSRAFQPWIFNKVILPYFMNWLKVIIDDKNIMEPIIMNSSLDWTIVRCPNITDKPAKNKITASLDGKNLKLSITNADTAHFIVKQLTDKTFSKQAPSISN
jgi:putative NADH-flavin reductase